MLCENHEGHDSDDDTSKNKKPSLLYPILGIVSSFFLFLVVVFFFLIPEMRTLQNRSVVFQSATLAIGLVGLSVLHLNRGLLKIPYACKFFGRDFNKICSPAAFNGITKCFSLRLALFHIELLYLAHYDVLQYVLDFQVYMRITIKYYYFNLNFQFHSALKNMAAISQKYGLFKFKIYGVISTVFPLVILILMVILDFNLSEKWIIWPGIGLKRCWFQSE